MKEGIDLLAISRGLVTAPAGCGKTELIVRSIARHKSRKPVLILTHTNSGVAALRTRLNRAAVPSKHYRLSTLDGWAMRLISNFPARSGHASGLLELSNHKSDYPEIRRFASGLLMSGSIADILTASYDRVMVDEYQGRRLARRTVGSTLLVKGLEAEVAVVLHACELDASNLYVAMTRGSKLLVLCSKSLVLKPR